MHTLKKIDFDIFMFKRSVNLQKPHFEKEV